MPTFLLYTLSIYLIFNLAVAIGAIPMAIPKAFLQMLKDPERYNQHASPTQDTAMARRTSYIEHSLAGTPTYVNISMYIEGISSFQATTMDFQLDIYFQQHWTDTRLHHNNSRRILIRDLDVMQLMWRPDLYFANARLSSFHTVTEPNFLIWVYQNGTVYYDCRISLTVMCMQNFMKYPFDTQECTLRILSYAYDADQLSLSWAAGGAVAFNPNITMPDMLLVDIVPGNGSLEYATGVWDVAWALFIVRREIMHHILQNYVPTGLIVTISWFSFWLDVDSVPGRVSLSITTLLTLATQASAARLALPQVSYIKAIDVWMGTCMTFVFAAMIEFTIVNYWTRRKAPPPALCSCICGLKKWKDLFSSCGTGSSYIMKKSTTTQGLISPPCQCDPLQVTHLTTENQAHPQDTSKSTKGAALHSDTRQSAPREPNAAQCMRKRHSVGLWGLPDDPRLNQFAGGGVADETLLGNADDVQVAHSKHNTLLMNGLDRTDAHNMTIGLQTPPPPASMSLASSYLPKSSQLQHRCAMGRHPVAEAVCHSHFNALHHQHTGQLHSDPCAWRMYNLYNETESVHPRVRMYDNVHVLRPNGDNDFGQCQDQNNVKSDYQLVGEEIHSFTTFSGAGHDRFDREN